MLEKSTRTLGDLPYRTGRAATPELRLRYVPVGWRTPVPLVGIAASACILHAITGPLVGLWWVTCAAVCIAICVQSVWVSVYARVVGADLVLSSSRWPGAVRTLRVPLHEVIGFDVVQANSEGNQLHAIAITTHAGERAVLTERMYPGFLGCHAHARARLQEWLNFVR
jgi:hypothetical protein